MLGCSANEEGRLFETGSNAVWDRINKGVCARAEPCCLVYANTLRQRQWKDIKHRYMESDE